ncbi:hypothetical protein Tco_0651493 [Tanacetum coccineum]|uniref:Retrovirus-related Pol polyprotein from transposon TNT 1-94-like beta-barrel domain-containing protein n=1 Tax=Tanacetum coccineum TaxID=301880 RepID=A0ABQ4WUX0_9ASTR
MVEGDGCLNNLQKPNKNKRKFKNGADKFAQKKGTMIVGNDDEVAWWVDSGATSHVCKDLRWFQVCKSIEDGSFVKMGNVATEPIKGIGRVLLTFTSRKTLCLDNVLYVPGIRKNLLSVNSIIESRDAMFDEERFTSIPRPRGMIQPSSSKIAEDEVEGTDNVPGPSVPRKKHKQNRTES